MNNFPTSAKPTKIIIPGVKPHFCHGTTPFRGLAEAAGHGPASSTTPAPVGSATVADATTAEAFIVELVADAGGPPWPIRMRKWLKEAGRAHGLTCTGVTPVPAKPTGHLAITNAATNHWRPTGRAIRRAAAGPLGHVRASDDSRVGPAAPTPQTGHGGVAGATVAPASPAPSVAAAAPNPDDEPLPRSAGPLVRGQPGCSFPQGNRPGTAPRWRSNDAN